MTGYVTPKFGDHEITMTTEEADRLTDEQRSAYAAAGASVAASVEGSLRAKAVVGDRAHAAVAETGDVVVQGWCDRCGDEADPIAVVRRFSHGYVFDGRGSAEMDPSQEVRHLSRLREAGAGRVPFVVQGRVQIILTEQSEKGTDWPPRATCPMHGESRLIDPNALLRLAKSARLGHPEKLAIHPET